MKKVLFVSLPQYQVNVDVVFSKFSAAVDWLVVTSKEDFYAKLETSGAENVVIYGWGNERFLNLVAEMCAGKKMKVFYIYVYEPPTVTGIEKIKRILPCLGDESQKWLDLLLPQFE